MRNLKRKYTLPGLIICVLGLLTLWALYALWLRSGGYSLPAELAALVSVALFAVVCLRFVPGWMRFWTPGGYAGAVPAVGEPPHVRRKIFFGLLLCCLCVQLIVYILYVVTGHSTSLSSYLRFWECLDSGHYVDIARDWYLSEGDHDRVVQLVFLPGYPIAMRLAHYIVGDYALAGILVSIVSFSAAGSVIHSLLRLDYSHETAMRAIKYLCVIPGSFFFVAPMSESLFLLLSAGCVCLVRRGRVLPGCLLGAYAAFTRSLGLMLFVPACMELVHSYINSPRNERRFSRFFALLLIPAGFGAYLLVNYQVSGNAFQYMVYQSEHWSQRFGLFFATAAYQTDSALKCLPGNLTNFFGLWLPNLLFCFAALAMMAYAAPKMRPGYAAWFIAYFFVAIGVTWLLSAPRYLISLLPFFLSAALCSENRRRDTVMTLACAALSMLYAAAFVLRWQVW